MKTCEQCGTAVDPAEVQPIRDSQVPTQHLCLSCVLELAEEAAEGIWALAHSVHGEYEEVTDDTRRRFMIAALISLNQRIAADALAKTAGIEIPWRKPG